MRWFGCIGGSKVTEPLKPASDQVVAAVDARSPIRFGTVHCPSGVGVGVGGVGGVGVGVAVGVGVGGRVGFGVFAGSVGSGGSVAPPPGPPGASVAPGSGVSPAGSLAPGWAVAPAIDVAGVTTGGVAPLVSLVGASVTPATCCSGRGAKTPRRAAVAMLEMAKATRPGSQRRTPTVGGVQAGMETFEIATLGSDTTDADRLGRPPLPTDGSRTRSGGRSGTRQRLWPRLETEGPPTEGEVAIVAAVTTTAGGASLAPSRAERVGTSAGGTATVEAATVDVV